MKMNTAPTPGTSPTNVPPGWGTDELSKFWDAARSNQFGTFVKKGQSTSAWSRSTAPLPKSANGGQIRRANLRPCFFFDAIQPTGQRRDTRQRGRLLNPTSWTVQCWKPRLTPCTYFESPLSVWCGLTDIKARRAEKRHVAPSHTVRFMRPSPPPINMRVSGSRCCTSARSISAGTRTSDR